MSFDPEATQRALLKYELAICREDTIEEAKAKRAVGGAGNFIYCACLDCCLVGLFAESRELLPKAEMFLEASVERNEPDWEALTLVSLAMCRWLRNGTHDAESLKKAVEWREAWFADYRGAEKTETQLVLPEYLDAGQYDLLFQRFAAAGLKVPTRLRQIQGEGTMSYVIARHRAGLEYTAEEVAAAIETFLKRHVDEWLSNGHTSAVARWMKIAFWKPGDDPIATLLRCYDYLPDLAPPRYP